MKPLLFKIMTAVLFITIPLLYFLVLYFIVLYVIVLFACCYFISNYKPLSMP